MILVGVREVDEVVARRQRLAAVTLDYLAQVDAAPIVAIRRRRAHAPERYCQELLLQCPIEVPFPEVRAQVVALEVGEDVFDEEGLQGRPLQVREGAGVIGFDEQRGGGREQVVENPPLNVEDRLDVCYTVGSLSFQDGKEMR